MKITGTIEATDYIAAQRLNMHPRKSLRRALYALLVIAILGYSLIIKDMILKGESVLLFWIVTLGIGYSILYNGWFLPWKTRKLYRQYTALHKPFEFYLSDDSFHVKNEEGESQTKWAEFHKWKEGKGLFLIYRADNLFYMISKRCLGSVENIEILRKILQDNIGKAVT